MSATDERLEILIGKFLDGEISPSERQLLDEELSRNCEARTLLEQLQALHESSRAVVASQIASQAGEPEEIFERAWRHHEKTSWRRVVKVKTDGHLRFAVGLAAGFLLGLVLHFALVWTGTGPNEPAEQPGVVPHLAAETSPEARVRPAVARDRLQPVIRNVDWYGFTDDAGNQWLVEGVREGMIRPAAYHGAVR